MGEHAQFLRQRRPLGVRDVIDHEDRAAGRQDDHAARLLLDGAAKGLLPVAGGGEMRRLRVLRVHQHVVEGRILAEPGHKLNRLAKLPRLAKPPAAGKKVIHRGLELRGRIAAIGQALGDRPGVEGVNKKFPLGVRQAAPGAQFVQDGRQHEAARPAGLPFQRAQQLGGGALPPAGPLQNELRDLCARHAEEWSKICRTLARKASG